MFPPTNSTNDNNDFAKPAEVYDYLTRSSGNEFHTYREQSGLSLRDIYSKENVSMAVVSDFENGKKMPRVETLIRLMALVNMPYSELFNIDRLPCQTSVATRVSKIQGTDTPEVAEFLLSQGFNRKEIDDIMQYMDFVVSRRK